MKILIQIERGGKKQQIERIRGKNNRETKREIME
jgi:hypothetical protein